MAFLMQLMIGFDQSGPLIVSPLFYKCSLLETFFFSSKNHTSLFGNVAVSEPSIKFSSQSTDNIVCIMAFT